MILEQIYRDFPKDTIEGEKARMLLFQTHWFSSIAELDPRTAEALPQTLSAVLWKISAGFSDPSAGLLKDRLWRITEHVRLSLEKLFHELNESPHREHAILPIRSVPYRFAGKCYHPALCQAAIRFRRQSAYRPAAE